MYLKPGHDQWPTEPTQFERCLTARFCPATEKRSLPSNAG
jgi:hypothetical protein